MKRQFIKIISILLGMSLAFSCSAHTVTVTLQKTCDIDMRLWQVGTSYSNVKLNPDKNTFTVDFPTGTEVCAYVNQNSYCSCWGYKYCDGPEPEVCPSGMPNKNLLVLIIGGCATITKDSNTLTIPIECSNF